MRTKPFLYSFLNFIITLSIFAFSANSMANTPSGIFTEEITLNPADVTPAATRSRASLIDTNKLIRQTTSISRSSSQQQDSTTTVENITINLFDNVIAEAQRTSGYKNASGSITWIGKVEDQPGSTVIIVLRKDSIYGVVEIPAIGTFSIRPTKDGAHIIEQIKDSAVLSGEDDTVIPPKTSSKDSNTSSSLSQPIEISNDNGSIIDVYVAYDQDAVGGSVAPADAQSYAELFIAYTNQAYKNSNISQRVWLVGSVDGFDHNDTNTGSLNADLDAATGVNGLSITGLHAKRDEYHADLVLFFTPLTGSSCSGLAWLQTSNNSVSWNTNGFAVMEACSFGSTVFAHELGHNMGSRHDWYMDNGTSPDTIAHGYIDTTNNFRTIMSYGNRCSALGNNPACPIVAHFSNPAVNFNGAATGVSTGTSTSCATNDASPATECDADNATNFNAKALTTSQFRDSRLTWTGTISNSWATAGNWTINEGIPGSTTAAHRVPRSYDNVYIPSGLSVYPTITGAANARELTIQNGATLNMTGGTLTVSWSWEDDGGFNATGGTVNFSGPLGIKITSNSAFNNVLIGSGSDTTLATLDSNIDINGGLQINVGAKLNADTYTINLAGNWQENNTAGFNAGTGAVIFDGTTQTVDKIISQTLLDEDFSEGDGNGCCSTVYLPPVWTRESAWYGGEIGGSGIGFASGNGWLHTPELLFTSGSSYTLNLDFNQLSGSDTLRIYYGSSANSSSMTSLIGTVSNTGVTSFTFTVPTTGTYYIGFHHDGMSQSYIDNVQLIGELDLGFHTLQIASGITTFNQAVSIANNLQIDNGGVADFVTHAITVEGTITNNGSIKQTKTVINNALTAFGLIKNAAGTATKYYGIDITPSTGNMGSTSVEISGNQTCATSGTPASGVKRCYIITPGSNQTAAVKFYYRSAESNSNSAPDIYLQTGSSWIAQTTTARGGSGEAIWASSSSLTSYGTFSLSENMVIPNDNDNDGIPDDVDPDDDNDGMPDTFEIQYGFDPFDPSDAQQDADGDGFTNLQEFQMGTNPLQQNNTTLDFIIPIIELILDDGL